MSYDLYVAGRKGGSGSRLPGPCPDTGVWKWRKMMSTACITGASSGIGTEFARQLAAKGYDLILVARNRTKMEKLADSLDVKCDILPADLSDYDECVRIGRILSERDDLTMLINNAGFGSVGRFVDSKLDWETQMIHVNVRAVEILMRLVLPSFIMRNKGYILNVGSVAGLFDGGPYMATYYASKAFVVSLSGAVNEELRSMHSRVHVSVLCPGPVSTNFNNTAGVRFTIPSMSAKACVANCLFQMKMHRLIIIPSAWLDVGMGFMRLVPRRLQLMSVKYAQKKKMD